MVFFWNFFINASINKLFRSFISAICWIYIVHARNLCDLVFSVIVVTINFNYPTLNRVTLLRYEFTTQFLWWCDVGSLLNELRRAIIIYINVVSQFIISIFKWMSRNFNKKHISNYNEFQCIWWKEIFINTIT